MSEVRNIQNFVERTFARTKYRWDNKIKIPHSGLTLLYCGLNTVISLHVQQQTVQYSGCNTDIVLGDAGIQAGGKAQSSTQTSGSVWHCLIICHMPRLFLEAVI